MTSVVNIGQSNFIEVISVKPFVGRSCVPNISLGTSNWQNPVNRFDVNNDGVVSLEDYIILQDWLKENGETTLNVVRPDGEPYLDINGDGRATAKDIQLLSKFLNEGNAIDYDPEECFAAKDFRLERDLIDPGLITNVRQAAAKKGLTPFSNYRVFLRNFTTKELIETDFQAAVKTKDSFVFIDTDLLVVETPTAFPVRIVETDTWQNPLSQYDVNGDGVIDQNDLDDLQEWIDEFGVGTVSGPRPVGELFVDVDGDGQVGALDKALLQQFFDDNGDTEVDYLISTVIISDGTLGCDPTLPILERIKSRISNNEILPERFLWPS
jgi:Ca2+-binding EF-hand superfamily protein